MPGPLSGLRVVELAGLGPAPFCGMVFSDLGATVVRVDRVGGAAAAGTAAARRDPLNRGKHSIALDLKVDEGVEIALQLVKGSEVLIEGFRPGVTERLGLGPEACMEQNPALVYGRVTGWGRSGPLAAMAGHDIDYIAVSGSLHPIGVPGQPVPPLNLVGDFGGGGMLLAVGVVAAVLHARATGVGQVVDAAMVDGSALLATMQHGMVSTGSWASERQANLLDGGAPFYSTYETSDGRHIAVGALEPQFFAALLEGLDLDPSDLPDQADPHGWPQLRSVFSKRFSTRTRDEWAEHFEGTDACVAPVLSLTEAPLHPANEARGVFVDLDGMILPAPAPRFSKTESALRGRPPTPGEHTDSILTSLGYSQDQISKLRSSGTVA